MIEIKLHYRPVPFAVFKKQFKVCCPESFEELTPKQLIAFASLMRGLISDVDFLGVLTHIPKRILKKLSPFEKLQLSLLAEPFFETKPYHEFIIPSLCNGALTAPKPKLKHMSFGQFIFADTYFSDYAIHKNKDDLYKFTAALYLPKNSAFNENIIEHSYPFIKKTDETTLQAVLINYQLIRDWLAVAYPLIFIKHDSKKDKSKVYNPAGWIKVLDALVGDDIVHHDKYALMPLHNVFRYMTNRIKENSKRKY